jgi:hypothetical protein
VLKIVQALVLNLKLQRIREELRIIQHLHRRHADRAHRPSSPRARVRCDSNPDVPRAVDARPRVASRRAFSRGFVRDAFDVDVRAFAFGRATCAWRRARACADSNAREFEIAPSPRRRPSRARRIVDVSSPIRAFFSTRARARAAPRPCLRCLGGVKCARTVCAHDGIVES